MQFFKVAMLVVMIVSIVVGCAHKKPKQSYRDEIDSLLNRLSQVAGKSGDGVFTSAPSSEDRQDVRDSVLRIAKQTPETRSEVIEVLLQIVNDPKARDEFPIAYRWTMAVDLLGELRATEAIDVLIRNLDRTGGNGLIISPSYRPVAEALAKIGEPAIPQLIEALASNDEDIRYEAELALAEMGKPAKPRMLEALEQGDARIRGKVALVLAYIGGEDARAAIERAIEREEDRKVRQEIKEALIEMHSVWGAAASRVRR